MNSRFQPALLGGLFIGVLSALPFIDIGNYCCCLWVVSGGVLTTYLLQQKMVEPVQTSDAMLAGVLAGIIGAAIMLAGQAVILTITGPLWQEPLRQAIERNPDLTPEMQQFIYRITSGQGMILMKAIISLPMYAIFAMLGALLGVAFFKKKTPPMAAPAAPTIQG